MGRASIRRCTGAAMIGASFLAAVAQADVSNFDDMKAGGVPPAWVCGVTGRGSPLWSVVADVTAPSGPNVLRQSGQGTYPWCVRRGASVKDGFVEVRFKPVAGREDQAGGLVWRWQDGDNYYIARANALEDNVTIYRTVGGTRRQFKSTDVRVVLNQWHKLRVDFSGSRFRVALDGRAVIEATDDTFGNSGSVGIWTKADSVTLFDDFSFGTAGQ